MYEKWKWKSLSCVWLFATPWTIYIQSVEFSWPEYWLSYLTDSVIFCSRVVTQKIFFHCKTKGHTSENVSYILVFKCCLEEEDILKLNVIYFIWHFLSLNTLAQGIYTLHIYSVYIHIPSGSAGKESTCNAGDLSLIPGLGRSPGEENGYPLQYSQTRLSDFHSLKE